MAARDLSLRMRGRGKELVVMRKITWLLLLAFMAGTAGARTMDEGLYSGSGPAAKPAALPNTQLRVHDVGKLWLSVTNYGFFGSQEGEFEDAAGLHDPAPGCEYPGGSSLDYLFQGALWIGAEVSYDSTDAFGNVITVFDTLVSIGNDGWWGTIFELFPAEGADGAFKVRSTRPPSVYPYGDTIDAISEQDYLAVYYDTVTSSVVVPDPNDQRPHIPLGIEIDQNSYAWSYEYAEDFVLFDYDIINIGAKDINKVWIGLYIDADVYHRSITGQVGAQDDICGFDSVYVSLTGDTTRIYTAWIADNDGDPEGGAWDYTSPRGVSGVRVVRAPMDTVQFGFNWWISNVVSSYDWGPQLQANYQGPFPGGGDGTPGGDKAKYRVMSNNEFDYDQVWCNLSRWTGEGWRPPSPQASDLADGYDTRYLFSFGEFESILPGDSLKLTAGYICGENLHVDPANFQNNLQGQTTNESRIQQYYDNLDFSDFATNSQWASWVYDNPGVDTDTTDDVGYPGWWQEGVHFSVNAQGDTFWFAGDGVPDFAGPPPPPSPILDVATSSGTVDLRWNGSKTESEEDTFSKLADFEGYRIYMSRSGQLGQYTLLADYDIIDYDSTFIDSSVTPPAQRIWKLPPRKLSDFPAGYNPDDHPDLWAPHGWNTGLGQIAAGNDTTYAFTVSNLSETVGMYFAVTAYDYGNPVTNLSPLESSPTINAIYTYAIAEAGQSDKVYVYPNPYKITDVGYYLDQRYEDPDQSGNTQLDRRIWFSGFSAKSTIRIFTLDGDLVRQLEYDPAVNSNPVISWDLISRNTQAVVSGIYIYAIESDNGYKQLGKIAIIK